MMVMSLAMIPLEVDLVLNLLMIWEIGSTLYLYRQGMARNPGKIEVERAISHSRTEVRAKNGILLTLIAA